MKKAVLSLFLLLSCSMAGFAQGFSLAGERGPIANGGVIVLSGPSDTSQLVAWLHLSNLKSTGRSVMMKKEDVSVPEGVSASICWAGFCNRPDIYVSLVPLAMQPWETVYGCFAHLIPNGYRGLSKVRWTFYDEADPNDSVSVTIHYSTFPTGTAENSAKGIACAIAGVDPQGDRISVRYLLPAGKQGKLELRSMTGKVVASAGPVSLSGTVSVSTAGIPAGIYFCSLTADGGTAVTRKVLLCR